MKKALILFLTIFCFVKISAQPASASKNAPVKNDLQKLVETEQTFAKTAAEKNTKTAFLEFLADDGIVFTPTESNGKLVWKARPESPALLAWNPAWADLSSDGKLGYTTGGWEFRPQGKTDKPAGFGEYVTLWQKQSDGSFKAVLDIGINHPASSFSAAAAWKSPTDAGTGVKSVKSGVNSSTLTDIFSNKSMANGYFNYLADDCLILRDGNLPFYGKQNAFLALEKLEKEFPSSSFLNFSGNMSKIFGNMMYVWGVYQLSDPDKTVKKWNFMQIWKHRNGRWQIVLDIFNPIPPAKK
ncbi:MAG TPA: nuclear transport factor 2 family protein [Pyrinomonadaceae bacterium]|nr:nuclear transport factor 2 family protein [Pyrinomonadaceae bacterium]